MAAVFSTFVDYVDKIETIDTNSYTHMHTHIHTLAVDTFIENNGLLTGSSCVVIGSRSVLLPCCEKIFQIRSDCLKFLYFSSLVIDFEKTRREFEMIRVIFVPPLLASKNRFHMKL